MNKIIWFLIIGLFFPAHLVSQEKNKGDFSNLVCFLRFADEEAAIFDKPSSYYETLFNDEAAAANSVYNYFKEASYNQLFWKSKFFPLPDGANIVSYQAKKTRGYYKKFSSINPDGYVDDTWGANKAAREQALIKELVEYLAEKFPDNINIDINNDGFIDNLCIVVSGNSEIGSSHLLWPHRSALQLTNVPTVQGKKAAEYLMIFNDANGYDFVEPIEINTGVLCHEMSHTLGTYDLYHASKGLSPIGIWDLMSDNQRVAQQMSAYTKFKYCKWIDEIPEISEPGTYTLNPVGGTIKENIAYKIKPTGSDEYFVVEYRKKEGTFDIGLPSSGLLVYRVNPKFTGNVNYNGTDKLDELYIFRPGGTITSDGDISKATFSAESGRTSFGGTSSSKPFYSDGREAKFAINNISSCGSTISFDLLPISAQIYLPQSKAILAGAANSSTQLKVEADVAWEIKNLPEWITVSPTEGESGVSTITITATSSNEEISNRVAEFRITGTEDASIFATVSVSQSSNVIQPPYSLNAEIVDEKVVLTWMAPQEGSAVLTEDFEDPSNPKGWQVETENGVGWAWSENSKYSEAHSGNYSVRLSAEMEDRHQDERLISPLFANGKSLSFYSKSIAPGKTNIYNFYYVEVSKDGGDSWIPVWDLMKDGKTPNKYERVDIDLSDYLSDNMRIAFHAYDTNEKDHNYLSYWWNIDGISVYPQVENSLISEYHIYRNGEKIGTATSCTYIDESPLSTADNIYTVKAVGSFGETPDSESVTVQMQGTGVESLKDHGIHVTVVNNVLAVQSEQPLKEIILYSTTGMRLKQVALNDNSCELSLSGLPSGIYVVQVFAEGLGNPRVVKIVK